MIMNTKQFYEFESSIRKSCENIVPTDIRKVVCGKMLIEDVKSLHLEKTENSCECIIMTHEYFPGNMNETSRYGYKDYVNKAFNMLKDNKSETAVKGYISRIYHAKKAAGTRETQFKMRGV